MPSSRSRQKPPPIVTFPLPYLILPPLLLALLTLIILFIHSDVNGALLWSECHSHARIPFLTRDAPLPSFITTPLCALTSFFQAALGSTSSAAMLAIVLAFMGGLLTVHTVEAARVCNASSVVIAYPTGAWVLFNLVGGAFVWELVLIPAFLHRAKRMVKGKVEDDGEEQQHTSESAEGSVDESRHLPDTEIVAIPTAIAFGFYLPTILMLIFKTPVMTFIWLFFPIYVSLLRQSTRYIVAKARRSEHSFIHIESGRWSLVAIYALPVVFSILTHIIGLWLNATRGHKDQRELTRSIIKFVEIDGLFVWLTVLYWMLAEVGWRVPVVAAIASVIVGPGAGTCLSWLYRENLIHHVGIWSSQEDDSEEEGERQENETAPGSANEETPLLTS